MALSFLFGGNTKETPESIKRKRELAMAIMGASPAPKNIGEGLNALGSGIVAGVMNRRANKAEDEGRASADTVFKSAMQGQLASQIMGTAPSSMGINPASGGASGGSGSYRDAIASIESAGSGDYRAVGPTHPKMGRALGRYQIMEANVGPWSREVLGREVTPDEFMANPQLQDAIFDGKFNSYVQKFGPEGAAQAWFAGPGGVGKTNRKDSLGTDVGTYGRKFMSALGPQAQQPTEVASLNPAAGMPPQTATGAVNAMAAGGGAVIADESQYSPEDRARLAALRGPAPSSVPYSGPGARIDTPTAIYDDKGFRMEPQGQRPQQATPSLSDEMVAFEQTPEYRAQFPGMNAQQPPQGPIQNAPQQQSAIPPQLQGSQQLANGQGGIMPALMGGAPASPEQVAQAQAMGQQQPPQQAPAQGGPDKMALLQALSNPWLSQEQKAVLQTLYQQQEQEEQAAREQQIWQQRQQYEQEAKRNDPSYQLGLKKTQAELDQMGKPEYRTLTPEEREQYGIPDTDQRLYQVSRGGKIDAVGGAGQTINVGNEIDARKAAAAELGLSPDDPRYESFVLTGKFPREDSQSLTATDKKAILEADEMVAANQSALDALSQAEGLSDEANSGWFAGARASIGNNLPDWMVPDIVSSPQSSQATTDMDNAIIGQAITQLKTIFGGNPTEGERNILLELQGSSTMPREVRKQVFSRARALAEKRLQFNNDRAADLRGGTYYKPDRAPATGQNIDDLLKKYGTP
ncbi:hypothetical protein CN126_14525 [Sinorhizobium meliloti]|uniref:hypothetical protein n=1 Tax=Rhizobium meliloti TaxID=382 RepID=UPI000FDAD6C1|nr:hypothetical protein [Sinorhizobium meliloti]RVK59161.1 hypothetical protein CN162_07660 [Sinorhizobium meliloti]RVM76223.1 hypothetical protein CN126_14525 [Sinorhizobium meliloti]RVM95319.1 hypothetical protein CN122_06565 [Sinorhizobium meliloti]RVN74715.1 hypothetical protein CN110_09100 [Sinorhizobium meliloti]